MLNFSKFFKQKGSSVAAVGQALSATSALTALLGLIYTIDCRITAGSNNEKVNNCYLTGVPLMGLGVAGRGGFQMGYRTYNPALRDPREGPPPDLSHRERLTPPPPPPPPFPPSSKDLSSAEQALSSLHRRLEALDAPVHDLSSAVSKQAKDKPKRSRRKRDSNGRYTSKNT